MVIKNLGEAESEEMRKVTRTNFSLVLLWQKCIKTINLHHYRETNKEISYLKDINRYSCVKSSKLTDVTASSHPSKYCDVMRTAQT